MDESAYNLIVEELEYFESRKDKLEKFVLELEKTNIPEDLNKEMKSRILNEIEICNEQIDQISNDLEKNELKADLVAKYGE